MTTRTAKWTYQKVKIGATNDAPGVGGTEGGDDMTTILHSRKWHRKGFKHGWAPAEVRFWGHVAKSETCWEWNSSSQENEYGSLSVGGRKVKAHRFSWELHFGPITGGLYVLHRCDNKRCVKPDHLFLGTNQDNILDASAKGRLRPHGCAIRTACRKGHEYSDGSFHLTKDGYRKCLVCIKTRAAALQRGRE